MIENEIYCYVNCFLKWNNSKNTSYVVGNKKFFGKICIPSQLKDKSDVIYFKLPYIGNLSHHIKNKPPKLCKENFENKILTLS